MSRLAILLAILVCCSRLASDARAEVRLPKVFTEGMVLQQQMPIRLWGWATPGEEVTAEFLGQLQKTKASEKGTWRIELPAAAASSKPQELTIAGKNKIVLRNVLVGEVWLAVGQSNMSRGLRYVKDRITKEPMDFPELRLFFVGLDQVPQREEAAVTRGWAPATHAAMRETFVHPTLGPYEFSEVTYYFGKQVHEQLGVPVGMISCAFPGSTAAQWTPADKPEERFDFAAAKPDKGPGSMYQAMLLGLPPLGIRGVIYYQGENDASNPHYERELTSLIGSWRARFERPDMPFFMTQLGQTTFGGGTLRVIATQQAIVAKIPHTGLAGSNDLIDGANPAKAKERLDQESGFPIVGGGDPHPPNKHVVAGRLARLALGITYGKLAGEASGPMVESQEVRGEALRVKFRHAGKGLKTDDGAGPNWFQLAGAEGKWVAAEAKIVAPDTIELKAAALSTPQRFRFAWHALARHNLYNSDGLPAIPHSGEFPSKP